MKTLLEMEGIADKNYELGIISGIELVAVMELNRAIEQFKQCKDDVARIHRISHVEYNQEARIRKLAFDKKWKKK